MGPGLSPGWEPCLQSQISGCHAICHTPAGSRVCQLQTIAQGALLNTKQKHSQLSFF